MPRFIVAFQAASSPHTLRALHSNLQAFDLWCRRTHRITLPGMPDLIAVYLGAGGMEGSKLASISRYKASMFFASSATLPLKRGSLVALSETWMTEVSGTPEGQLRRSENGIADIPTLRHRLPVPTKSGHSLVCGRMAAIAGTRRFPPIAVGKAANGKDWPG